MSPVMLALLPGALVGFGLALILLRFAPRLIDVDDALDRLGNVSLAPAATPTLTRSDRIGFWVSRRVPNIPGFAIPVKQLDLLEIPVSKFYAQKLHGAAIGFLAPLILPIFFQLTFGYLFTLPLIISPVLALIMWAAPDATVKARSREAQREFTRFVTVYLELVAVALLGNTTPDRALTSAASVSDSWVFRRIRREYQVADLTRTSKWDALDRLGDQIEVPALVEMARMMRMAEARVGLRDQLRAACNKLRHQVAADDAVAAQKVTSMMDIPVMLTIAPILAILMAPALLQFTTL